MHIGIQSSSQEASSAAFNKLDDGYVLVYASCFGYVPIHRIVNTEFVGFPDIFYDICSARDVKMF